MKAYDDPTGNGCHAPCLNGDRNPKCTKGSCLVARAIAGDPVASDVLFTRLAKVLHAQALRLCRDRESAEDLSQDALLHAWEHLQQLRVNRQVLTWARRIVRNSFLMSRRQSLFAPVRVDTLDGHEDALVVEAHILERIAARDAKARVRHALEFLPDKLKAVFKLRVFVGLSTEETARELGVSRFVVRTRLRRARLALRQFGPLL